jgi:hypothetical protein
MLHFMCLSEHLLAKRAQQRGVVNANVAPLFLWLFGLLKKLQLSIAMLPLVS